MDPLEPNENKNSCDDMSIEQSLPPVESDLFGEQEIFPRIGEEFQIEVPELVTHLDYLSSIENPEKTENSTLAFFMGLPVPLMLTAQEGVRVKQETLEVVNDSKLSRGNGLGESENLGMIQIHLETERSEAKVKPQELDNGAASGGSEENLHESRGGLFLVPGCPSASWNHAEKESFLLALYIFQKNFVLVERFIESKKMGEILAFYYGSFYRSPEHCRWAEWRKMKSRRCVFGQKIFTGMRLQELLSRIMPNLSEECKQSLLEVCKVFGEAKISFEDYVFSLKAMVGLNLLVEAVGIGKGRRDLTGMTLEPSKSNNAMRPEIPIGKACSSLTTSEIVKFLTGDFRLSKARSNDLFWEAVWPRLLARGWHSEEPKDQVYALGLKNSLVFLTPGIKKFSRRRLVKGNHYFDSVTDVLSKVASEPGLIELDNEEDQSKKNKEESEGNDAKLEEDDSPSKRRQYLQPRTPSRTTDGMKFTVVDTSLGDGKPYKVRELRSLPFEIPNKWHSRILVEVSDEDSSEVSTDGSDDVDMLLQGKSESDNAKASKSLSNGKLVSDRKDLKISAHEQDIHMACPNADCVQVNDSTNNTDHLFADKQPRKAVKLPFSQGTKEDNLDNMAPVTKKRRRLTACSGGETPNVITESSVVHSRLEPEMPTCSSTIRHSPPQAVSSQEKLSLTTSSSRSSLSGSVDCARALPDTNCHGGATEEPQNGPQTQTLIDLNIPQVPLEDFENDISITEAATAGESDDHKSKNHLVDDDISHMSQDVNPQRRSTRNRPPTTRALEALANGYLTVTSRRKKTKEEISGENLASRSSRRARSGAAVGITTEVGSNSVDSMAEGSENSASTDKDNKSIEFQLLPSENCTPFSGPKGWPDE